MKVCTRCGTKKPLSEFHKAGVNKPNRASACKVCEAERKKESYYADVETTRAKGRRYSARFRSTPRGWANDLLSGAKRRAKKQRVACTLTLDWIEDKLSQQCAVTGLSFDLVRGKGRWRKQPFAPSIDRKKAGGDYTADNCRVVCLVVNEAMNQWGLEPVLIMADALRQTK